LNRIKRATKEEIEVARIIGKVESGKELTAVELLELLPYAILQDIENMEREFRETGKIKPRRRFRL